MVQTTSVLIQSLCVPCCNRCRYCLLSWNGTVEGVAWERSTALAERFLRELRESLPDVRSSFSFGYSMEHPELREAIRTLRRLGSPTAEELQCDGMKMRGAGECAALMEMLRSEGIRQLHFTVYGLREYHDRFAGREGDYDLLLRMMGAAGQSGIPYSAQIPLTAENIPQAEALIGRLRDAGTEQLRLFVPHEEGRGKHLSAIRLRSSDLARLSEASRRLLNRTVYRTEGEWFQCREQTHERNRMILITLTHGQIDDYERRGALSVVRELETLDERYYAAYPGFAALAERYGDAAGESMYSFRDLYHHYRALYAREHDVRVYDVTDERRSGSRRY